MGFEGSVVVKKGRKSDDALVVPGGEQGAMDEE